MMGVAVPMTIVGSASIAVVIVPVTAMVIGNVFSMSLHIFSVVPMRIAWNYHAVVPGVNNQLDVFADSARFFLKATALQKSRKNVPPPSLPSCILTEQHILHHTPLSPYPAYTQTHAQHQ